MKNLKTLVLMQLKDKVDFSYLKSTKGTIFKIVLSLLKFGIITGLIYAGFYVLSLLKLVSLLPGIPQNFFASVFTIMFILSVIFCTFGLMKNLYYTKDNQLLLTLPANRTVVFTSKLIVYYLYELIRNTTFMLPLFVAYAIINSFPIYFYLWLIIAFLIVTALPVVIGSLLSIPTMYVMNFIKQYKWLEYSILVLFITGTVFAILAFINAIPENLDIVGSWGTTFWQIQSFIAMFNKIFLPIGWVVTAIFGTRYGVSNQLFLGKQWLCMLGAVLVIIAIAAITYFIVRPLFFHMASTPFEYKKKHIKHQHKNKKLGGVFSAIKKELMLNYRTPEKFYGLLVVVVGMPIAILLLNKLYAAMDTRLTGTNMTIAFNILMILLISLSSSVGMAKTYSEEGASSYLLKTTPKSYLQLLTSKLLVNMFLVSISILVTTWIFTSYIGYTFTQKLAIFFMLEFIYLAHLLWSAEMDIMNPQTAHYQTTGTHTNNPNEIRSTIYAFILSAVFALLTFFLISERLKVAFIKMVFVASALLALRIYLYVNKIKVYFKESAL